LPELVIVLFGVDIEGGEGVTSSLTIS